MRYEVEEALFLHSQGVHPEQIAQSLGMTHEALRKLCDREGVQLDSWAQARTRTHIDQMLTDGRRVAVSGLPGWCCPRTAANHLRSLLAAGQVAVVGRERPINTSGTEAVYALVQSGVAA